MASRWRFWTSCLAVSWATRCSRELLREMQKAIRAVMAGEATSLEEAVWVVRNRSRRLGRILPRCAVGTTLLVKGLEFHHAVVLDADAYDAKNLYVALDARGEVAHGCVAGAGHPAQGGRYSPVIGYVVLVVRGKSPVLGVHQFQPPEQIVG